MRPGDRIVSLAGNEVTDLARFRVVLLAAENPVTAVVERTGETEPRELALDAHRRTDAAGHWLARRRRRARLNLHQSPHARLAGRAGRPESGRSDRAHRRPRFRRRRSLPQSRHRSPRGDHARRGSWRPHAIGGNPAAGVGGAVDPTKDAGCRAGRQVIAVVARYRHPTREATPSAKRKEDSTTEEDEGTEERVESRKLTDVVSSCRRGQFKTTTTTPRHDGKGLRAGSTR